MDKQYLASKTFSFKMFSYEQCDFKEMGTFQLRHSASRTLVKRLIWDHGRLYSGDHILKHNKKLQNLTGDNFSIRLLHGPLRYFRCIA